MTDKLEYSHSCKYVRRIGESCTLNNNCKYPNCDDEKLQKAEEALRLHMKGFPNQVWLIKFDRNLKMYSIVSEQYLQDFEPDYIV